MDSLPDRASHPPVVVSVDDVSKRFTVRKDSSVKERLVTLGRAGRRHREDFWALRGVHMEIRAGETIGLIGHNGSGKSTLLKVIGGVIQPTSGSVRQRGRVAALIELGAGFHPDLTGRENVYLNAALLGLSREETDDQFDDILSFSGIGEFIDTQVKFYSSGMYVRLAFAVAVHTDPDILLVDEVLAVGDEAFQRKCLDKIRSFQEEGRTIIIVSHSLGQITELCDRAVLMNRGEVAYEGDSMAAVSKFRDILEGRRRDEDAARAGGTDHEADGPVGRVLRTTVRAAARKEGEEIRFGDDLVVTAELEARETLTDWLCAIQIDNTLGQKVFGTDTRRLGLEMPPLRGVARLEFIVESTTLGSGKYFVNTSLMDSAGRHLHDTPQATSFNTENYERMTGMVRGAVSASLVLDE
ncbi:ABC transporter ATP-binding protein [Microbacterium schleiferi]|jgi:ABC-2 type transport system ATP-binding protein|uniref:ABC transporter ATP-binding protein n=1 Tax=Microbacterium schleiferi TaxID=69362 RepID=UPI000C382894|nr:ABC transporter ATP-binding protein [Henriciella sp.]MCC4267061.1 ABC transporter ATP-binding protein [Microbacterium schleiferi]|tara:strand:+ start:5099 stop:6334 length:1236 start_codon:yes stop_codon:yes gene_type:complete